MKCWRHSQNEQAEQPIAKLAAMPTPCQRYLQVSLLKKASEHVSVSLTTDYVSVKSTLHANFRLFDIRAYYSTGHRRASCSDRLCWAHFCPQEKLAAHPK